MQKQYKLLHQIYEQDISSESSSLTPGLHPGRIPYFETSAATGSEVDKAVITLLDLVMKRMEQCVDKPPDEPANGNGAAKLSEGPPSDRKCAC